VPAKAHYSQLYEEAQLGG